MFYRTFCYSCLAFPSKMNKSCSYGIAEILMKVMKIPTQLYGKMDKLLSLLSSYMRQYSKQLISFYVWQTCVTVDPKIKSSILSNDCSICACLNKQLFRNAHILSKFRSFTAHDISLIFVYSSISKHVNRFEKVIFQGNVRSTCCEIV
jgi:hypothetical protein